MLYEELALMLCKMRSAEYGDYTADQLNEMLSDWDSPELLLSLGVIVPSTGRELHTRDGTCIDEVREFSAIVRLMEKVKLPCALVQINTDIMDRIDDDAEVISLLTIYEMAGLGFYRKLAKEVNFMGRNNYRQCTMKWVFKGGLIFDYQPKGLLR